MKPNPLCLLCLALLFVGLSACRSTAPLQTDDAQYSENTPAALSGEPRDRVQTVRSTTGLVTSNSPAASRIGANILAKGGNAVDAAVATAFALAVAWPEAGNIGGGGFMLVARTDGSPPIAFDFRETAPAAATVDMYTPGESRHHARHVGVPGSVAGLAKAHAQFGKLSWRDVVQPAADLAREGVPVDAYLSGSLNRALGRLDDDDPAQIAETRRVYQNPDGPWQPGNTLVLPDLADTLQQIADGGGEAFYTGPLAERFEAGMKQLGGLITTEDLANYQAKVREPTHSTFRGYDVYGMPPPSSGGVCVSLILQMLEPFDLRDHPREGARNLHLIAEAMRRAFHQRALTLGDTDFVNVDLKMLTSKAHARHLADSIELDRATPSTELEPQIPITEESPSTTHFSVVDADGMAVSCTTTLEQSWGSRVVLPGLGFVLNNEMGDFNWTPGRTTRGGAIGTDPNLIAPGKRMLSSMSPTIVMRDGRPVLVTGSPGGRTIINTVACITLNVLEFGMPVEEAVQYPRMHHQWLPDELRLEAAGSEGAVIDATPAVHRLEDLGHRIRFRNAQGSAHTIGFNPDTGEAVGVADHRRGGAAIAP